MTEYLLLFRNTSNPDGYELTSQQMAEDLSKWQAWTAQIAIQEKLIYTAPVQHNGFVVNAKSTVSNPHKETNTVMVTGFVICKTDNPEEVQEWSLTCPILHYPNGTVEIRPLISFSIN